jgi:hypothetical protein
LLKPLTGLGHFIQCAQAACTDVNVSRDAIDLQAAVLNIQHKPTVGMAFRVTDIASVLWLSQTVIAASGSHPLTPFTFMAVILYDAPRKYTISLLVRQEQKKVV